MKKTAGSPLQSSPSVGMIETTSGATRFLARAIAALNWDWWTNALGMFTTPLSRGLTLKWGSRYELEVGPRYGRMFLRIPKQRPETFLLKMPVVGQNFGYLFFTHRLHRNAIRQAVAFVGTRTIQFQADKEGFSTLRNNRNRKTLDQLGNVRAGLGPDTGPRAGKECQIFAKDLIGRDDFVRRDAAAEFMACR